MSATNEKGGWFTLGGKNWYQVALAAMVLVLGAGVFMFFKSFFDSEPNSLTTEILAALLGSIITIIITMLLLQRQGDIEQTREAATASKTLVFQEKLRLFNQFIAEYTRAALDGHLDRDELEKLEVLSLTISLLATRMKTARGEIVDLAKGLSCFMLQLELFGLKDRYEELDEREKALHAEHFGDVGEDSVSMVQEKHLLSFVDILSMMKIELVMSQKETLEADRDLLQGTRYRQTLRLLNYRDYERSAQAGTSAPDGDRTGGDQTDEPGRRPAVETRPSSAG